MANRERDEESGQFSTKYEDRDFLEAMKELNGSGSTTEIAEIVDCDRRTAYLRLKQLESSEEITSREIGNSLLWELK